MSEPRALVLLGQPGCHLCHDMADVVRRVAPPLGFRLEERDVRERPEWAAYRTEIPVLLLDGHEVVRHRVDEDALRRLLADLPPA